MNPQLTAHYMAQRIETESFDRRALRTSQIDEAAHQAPQPGMFAAIVAFLGPRPSFRRPSRPTTLARALAPSPAVTGVSSPA
jgi:hypothetical protein